MKQNNNRTLTPKLRFPEFRDAPGWEKKKLSEITSPIFDGTHQTPTYIEAGIPFYSVENLISGNANKFISKKDYDLATKKNKPEKGDILLTRIGKIGFSQVVTWDYEFSVYVTLAVIKQSSQLNSHYLHHFMQSGFYQLELRSKSLSNAVPPKINMDSLRETKVLIPRPAEQQKIADCLGSLDEFIAAEGRKLAALRDHKSGFMQQLFPQPGETQPRLRFPEFRDKGEWENKTLGEVADYENGKAHEQDIDEHGKYIVVNSKFISTAGEVIKYSNSINLATNKDDILMVLSDVPNGRALARCFIVDEDDTYTVNQRICKITAKSAVSVLLFYILDRNTYFLAFDDGVKQTNLKKEDVLQCPVMLPQDEDEQQRIAACLTTIDTRISAQTAKIETLKQHKLGLMQQLFPSPEEP